MITQQEILAWFAGRLPAAWSEHGEPMVVVDRDEITVTLTIAAPDVTAATSETASETSAAEQSAAEQSAADRSETSEAVRAEAIAGRIAGFRDDTKSRRIAIAAEAERRFGRKVAWAVRIGDEVAVFTHLAVPAMTRLRQPERLVLDTLVAAGVAKSRSDALAWCVKLVGQHTDEWLAQLRQAIDDVDRIRAEGPTL